MNEEEPTFIDADQFQGGQQDKITFQLIILQHLKKIGTYASVEFRGGFWNRKPHPNSNLNITVDEYVPDTREVYSNSIEYLYDLLYPHFDNEMKEAGKKTDAELDKAFKDSTVTKEASREDRDAKQGEKLRRFFDSDTDKGSFRNERLILCRKLFRELSCFLKRQDYFKGKSFDDTA